ncbi:MAG TPA: VOC family protein [Candidatus Elarobacter sp.]|jgi:PhnB protein|nr:VOC family protein [Candidatus Elarobacter sp.]
MEQQLVPYVFFYGRCEEALEFYKSVFGGSYEIMRVSDAPADVQSHMPPAAGSSVMHASFTAGGIKFFASDGMGDSKTIDPDAGNISLALSASDGAQGEKYCTALANGGKITMPFSDAFWGGKFGQVVDKFGNEWMITAP